MSADEECFCRRCNKEAAERLRAEGAPFALLMSRTSRFVVCSSCGNKRCPKATDHRNGCSGSNEPGQAGSAYEWPSNRLAWTQDVPARTQFVPEGLLPRPTLVDRLRGYQELFAPGTELHRDLGMAAADIELLRREIAAVREKRSELRGGTGDG